MKSVLLLRAPEEDGPDRYEAAFAEKGYVPLSVPVLETVFVHVDILRDKIVHGPEEQGLSGVILTSKRAVEAWCEALRSIAETERTQSQDWRTVPFYVVGAATAAAASRIRTVLVGHEHLAPAGNQVRGGADVGTAECLAKLILVDLGSGVSHGGHIQEVRRMFYLTGDKNREILPEMLKAAGIELDALEVYRTTGSSTFRADLKGVLSERAPATRDSDRTEDEWGWVVHFAPSAAAVVTPVLQEVFGVEGCLDGKKKPEMSRVNLKVAAIGPTTASYLQDALSVRVDVVSPKPTPDALCGVIVAFDELIGGP